MSSPENLPNRLNLWGTVAEQIDKNPLLIPNHEIYLRLASAKYAQPVARLYQEAYERGDYFATRYNEPAEQIFNPDWLEEDFQNTHHLRFIFTGSSNNLLGATGFFHDRDSSDGTMLLTSDATQIAPSGRGKHIMDHFFKRIVPLIENADAGVVTDFVLTPESKGLRRTLQTDLGMIALGIHPHALRHRKLGTTRSEITAAKYPQVEPKQVSILQVFEPLYRIVQSQIPQLPEPDIYVHRARIDTTSINSPDIEVTQTVSASDTAHQRDALNEGFLPVEFDPDFNIFKVARYPAKQPNLEFILDNEFITANKRLVGYLKNILFASIDNQERGRSS